MTANNDTHAADEKAATDEPESILRGSADFADAARVEVLESTMPGCEARLELTSDDSLVNVFVDLTSDDVAALRDELAAVAEGTDD